MPLTPRPLAPLALRLVEIPGIPRVRGVQAVGLARLPTLIRGGASPLRRAAEQHPAQHRDLLRQLRDPGIGLRERLLGPLGTLTPVRHISGVTGHRREGHVLQNTPSPSNTPRTAPGVSRTKPQPRRRPRLQTHAALTPHVTTGGHSDSARPPTGSPNTYASARSAWAVEATRVSVMTRSSSGGSNTMIVSPRMRYSSLESVVRSTATMADGVPGWVRSHPECCLATWPIAIPSA